MRLYNPPFLSLVSSFPFINASFPQEPHLDWMEYMTSDHRVAGSSPAGCKSSLEADIQAIKLLRNSLRKTITCQSLATFDANPLNFSRLMPIYTHTSHVRERRK